ncbi:MAG: hypothetical protein M5U34_34890 [Chloroflexi bacterium]|nr:hypothetical protein [Chloroflexota bacterium]
MSAQCGQAVRAPIYEITLYEEKSILTEIELAVIGGSGLYGMAELSDVEEITLTTPLAALLLPLLPEFYTAGESLFYRDTVAVISSTLRKCPTGLIFLP